MTTELVTEVKEVMFDKPTMKEYSKEVIFDEPTMKEYSVVIDGVIEIMNGLDKKFFFNGLLDAIIEYVEKQDAFAGLSMSHKEYVEETIEETDGTEAA